MKRILNSSKFWATVIGTLASSGVYYLFNDSTYALAVLGAFSAVVVGTAVEDTITKRNGST